MNSILTITNTSAIIQFKENILLNALLPQIDLNLLIDSWLLCSPEFTIFFIFFGWNNGFWNIAFLCPLIQPELMTSSEIRGNLLSNLLKLLDSWYQKQNLKLNWENLKMEKPISDVVAVRRLVSQVNYGTYPCKFLSKLSDVCEWLTKLTNKNVKWSWAEEQVITF